MKTKVVWLTVMLALGITTGFAKDKIKGNGTIVTRTIQVDNFTDIRFGSGIESNMQTIGINLFNKDKDNPPVFNYTQATGAASMEISMDENLFPWLDIDQKGGAVRIGVRTEETVIIPTRLVITGKSPGLSNVEINGCMNFNAASLLKTESLHVSVSGVGDIRLDDLACGVLACDVSGVGNAYLTGKANTGSFNVSGVGKVFAFDCQVKKLECEVSGVGKMEVNATEQLSANTSGVGGIRYKGTANVSSSASGIGKIKRAD